MLKRNDVSQESCQNFLLALVHYLYPRGRTKNLILIALGSTFVIYFVIWSKNWRLSQSQSAIVGGKRDALWVRFFLFFIPFSSLDKTKISIHSKTSLQMSGPIYFCWLRFSFFRFVRRRRHFFRMVPPSQLIPNLSCSPSSSSTVSATNAISRIRTHFGRAIFRRGWRPRLGHGSSTILSGFVEQTRLGRFRLETGRCWIRHWSGRYHRRQQ